MSSLKDELTAKKQKAKEREEAAKEPGKGEALLAFSETVLASSPARLVAASDMDDEETALYTQDADNVLAPFGPKALEHLVYRSCKALNDSERREVMKYIMLEVGSTRPVDLRTVQPVAFADEPDVLTWNRLPFRRADLGEVELASLPAFAHILSLCDDPDALVLWIGSLLDPRSGRTQYLHLHGGGGNGKSTLFNAIAEVLGERHVVKTRADEFMNSHWGSIVEGARLLIFPDENNPGFFGTGKFKEFTGEETTSVNPKYEKPRSVRLTHKTAVFSNNRVEISTSVADRRRLLSISMADDPDGSVGFRWWYEELRSSGTAILAYCFAEYGRAVAADPSVRAFIPQQSASVQAAIERKYDEILDAIKTHFILTGKEDDRVDRAEVHRQVCEYMRERPGNRVFMQQVREALTLSGIEEGKRHGNVAVYRGLKKVAIGGVNVTKLPLVKA